MRAPKFWSLILFCVCLTLAALRAYKYPEYSTDEFAYMGNAVAMTGASVQAIHDTVYREARAGIPQPIFNHLTGNDPTEPVSESRSFHERSVNAYRFAEFLPCFAVRPIFNLLVYLLHFKLGVGLLRATVLIPVVSYWLTGWIMLMWASRYVENPWAALVSLVLLLCPPVWDLARSATPDALSSLVALAAMYLIFEKRKLLPGMILMMASVYIRTDNVLLVFAVLVFLYLADFGMKQFQAATLLVVAVGSVWVINHFAGDYGWKVLYYRSFVEPPVAVGEIAPQFGIREYLAALKHCVSEAVHGPYIPFVLMGLVGVLKRPPRAILGIATVTAAYTVAHLVIFPNPETRFFGSFFVAMGVSLASTLATKPGEPNVESIPPRPSQVRVA